jgi:hypothetical protein
MAEIIGKAGKWIGQAVDHVNSRAIDEGGIFEGSLHDYTQGPLNKMWRLMIINQRARVEYPKDLNRATGKANDALNLHYAIPGSLSESQKLDPWKVKNEYRTQPLPDTLPTIDSTNVKLEISKSFRDSRRSDRDKYAASKHNQIIIVNTNTSPVTSIILQNRPPTIQVNNQSYWVSVKSMGRNNPFMMYTGGEDSIQLEVSWFVTNENNRKEVLTKCRLLESWSRADGYAASPPTLKISWGSANIFENDQFILESASYQLSNFQSYSREYSVKSGADSTDRRTLDIGLAPQCATQTLIFKRVTNFNRTHLDIIPFEELEKVADIKIE